MKPPLTNHISKANSFGLTPKTRVQNTMFFVGDGISGTTFDRPDFQSMEHMKKTGEIGTVVIKDLSRFVREHILFDHCTQMIYPSLGVNFISNQEIVETISGKGTEILQSVVGQTVRLMVCKSELISQQIRLYMRDQPLVKLRAKESARTYISFLFIMIKTKKRRP